MIGGVIDWNRPIGFGRIESDRSNSIEFQGAIIAGTARCVERIHRGPQRLGRKLQRLSEHLDRFADDGRTVATYGHAVIWHFLILCVKNDIGQAILLFVYPTRLAFVKCVNSAGPLVNESLA